MKTILHGFISIVVGIIGYTIHGSLFWAIIDGFFYPIAIIKWLICHELTLAVIKKTFTWFFV